MISLHENCHEDNLCAPISVDQNFSIQTNDANPVGIPILEISMAVIHSKISEFSPMTYFFKQNGVNNT